MDSHIFRQVIFDKGTKATQWEKDVFSTTGAGTPHTNQL